MKTLLFLAAACLAVLALAPTAEAYTGPYRDLDPCAHDAQVGADIAVGNLCVNTGATWCWMWIEWTALPLLTTCLFAPLASTAAPALGPESPPDVQCMDVYSATQVPGTSYWLVRRDSCSAQVYECPTGYQPPAPPCEELQVFSTAAQAGMEAPPIDCMPYERRVDLSPGLTVVQGGCGSYVLVCDTRVTLDWNGDISCLTEGILATSSEPNCLPYRHETEAYSVTVVHDGCSGTDVFVCDVGAKEYVDGQLAKPDPNGFVMCTWESTGIVGPVIW